MMTTLATPSMALSSPKATRAMEPAMTPATMATAPSIPSQTRLSQESSLVSRAARSQSAPRGRVAAAAALAISITPESRKPTQASISMATRDAPAKDEQRAYRLTLASRLLLDESSHVVAAVGRESNRRKAIRRAAGEWSQASPAKAR